MNLTVRSRVPGLFSDWLTPRSFFGNNLFDFEPDLYPSTLGVNIPSVNVKELPKEYDLELAAPGLERKDFKLEVTNHTLSISAEKEEEEKESSEGYTRREFSYSSFSRTFNLPENANTDKIDATYENGLLKVVIPKLKETSVEKPKQIAVS